MTEAGAAAQAGAATEAAGGAGAIGSTRGAESAGSAGSAMSAGSAGLAGAAGAAGAAGFAAAAEWPLWEVFVRSKAGLDHKHCGSLHAADAAMAIQLARDVYTRRQEGCSVWVVRSEQIVASDPGEKDMYFDPAADKVYRHPSFYVLPPDVDHI